jgi:hypothetical protein
MSKAKLENTEPESNNLTSRQKGTDKLEYSQKYEYTII